MNPEVHKPSLKGLRRRDRTPISLSPNDLCRMDVLNAGQRLPLLIQPAMPDVDLAAWLSVNRELIAERLRDHGGVLFRNFRVMNAPQFEQCIRALSGELLEYTYRSTPRKRVDGKIYTSTEYPSDRSIPLHNEMSYSRTWPLKIWFFSMVPAARGGQTPIADSRKVFQRISPGISEQFARKQVMYVRNYGEGLDLPWQDVFQTDDRNAVERLCRDGGIAFEWKDDNRLTTRQVCQAVAVHPQTGDRLWFNQAHLFHVSSLDASARELLLRRFSDDELPRNAYYGDGSPIELSMLDEIREAYAAETILFPWEKGDLLLLDNMLTAHGRAPFDGPRTVLAGMAERWGSGDLQVEL